MRIDVPDRSADVFFYGLFMAMSYNLPQPPAASERNPEYAAKLRAVARKVGLPAEYLASIR